jgi:hypothetical protein
MSTTDQSILDRLQRAKTKREPKKVEPPKRNTPLKKSDKPLKKSGKPKGRSEKMRGIISALRPLYDQFLATKEACEIRAEGCTGRPECVHHLEGRGINVILDQTKWKASCANCNSRVEQKDAEARASGNKRSRHAKN